MPDSSDDESEAKAPLSTMEQMLQVIMENQEKAEERNTLRFAAMQDAIDASLCSLLTLVCSAGWCEATIQLSIKDILTSGSSSFWIPAMQSRERADE